MTEAKDFLVRVGNNYLGSSGQKLTRSFVDAMKFTKEDAKLAALGTLLNGLGHAAYVVHEDNPRVACPVDDEGDDDGEISYIVAWGRRYVSQINRKKVRASFALNEALRMTLHDARFSVRTLSVRMPNERFHASHEDTPFAPIANDDDTPDDSELEEE